MPSTLSSKIDWSDAYPAALVAGVRSLPGKKRLGVSRFLTWLERHDEDAQVARLRAALQGRDEPVEGIKGERAFFDVVTRWRDAHLYNPEATTSEVMRAQDVSSGLKGLVDLRGQGLVAVPTGFRPRMVPVGRRIGDGWPTLGQSQWPELDGLSALNRERRGLEMARLDFLSMFNRGLAIFDRGQSLLAAAGLDKDQADLRDSILAYRDHVRLTGELGANQALRVTLICDPGTWRRAGFVNALPERPTFNDVLVAHRECLGPSTETMIGALGVFACDTGWNLQPIRDLPRDPYVFRSPDTAFLAEEAFVECFKRRSGRHVVAYLGNARDASAATIMREKWAEVVQADGHDSAHALLDRGSTERESALDVVESYRTMAEHLRTVVGPVAPVGDGLWIYVSSRSVVRSLQEFATNAGPTGGGAARIYPMGSVLARKGFGFRSVRKTWLALNRHDTGSIHATRAAAGHKTSSVLMPHYLNTPSVNAELDESVRRFQDAMQAILVRHANDETAALVLGVPASDLARMRQVAEEAGLATTLGLDARMEDPSAAVAVIHFQPTRGRLIELFLIHRELRRIQSQGGNTARFRARHLPLLALCKALGREVFARHLGPAYVEAARAASTGIRKGLLASPSIED
jgi:hypothetical protein